MDPGKISMEVARLGRQLAGMTDSAMILEGLCTTQNKLGGVNLAPMGPVVNESLTQFLFRPFQTSQTFQNLRDTRSGVFHITDDAALISRAALGLLEKTPKLVPAETVDGQVLADCCRWYEFEVVEIDDRQARTEITTRITYVGHGREFLGFNRAKHALLEAAILGTRVHLLDPDEIRDQLARLTVIVSKTASTGDQEAFDELEARILSDLSTG